MFSGVWVSYFFTAAPVGKIVDVKVSNSTQLVNKPTFHEKKMHAIILSSSSLLSFTIMAVEWRPLGVFENFLASHEFHRSCIGYPFRNCNCPF